MSHVLLLLFENPDYPNADLRAGGKGKGERVGGPDDEDNLEGKGKAKDSSSKIRKIDYASIERPFSGGLNNYDRRSSSYVFPSPNLPLFSHFESPSVTPKHLFLTPLNSTLRQLQIHRSLYAPTHISISSAEKNFEENKQQKEAV